jgi:hypothetical protein
MLERLAQLGATDADLRQTLPVAEFPKNGPFLTCLMPMLWRRLDDTFCVNAASDTHVEVCFEVSLPKQYTLRTRRPSETLPTADRPTQSFLGVPIDHSNMGLR